VWLRKYSCAIRALTACCLGTVHATMHLHTFRVQYSPHSCLATSPAGLRACSGHRPAASTHTCQQRTASTDTQRNILIRTSPLSRHG
jgi:hypothetical protein